MSDLKSGLQWRQEASVDRTVGDEYRNTPKKKLIQSILGIVTNDNMV